MVRIMRKLTITRAIGLMRSVEDNPFLWVSEYTGTPPSWIRWVWNPQRGTMYLGAPPSCRRHVDIIPPSRRYPFGAWVRGFFFPAEKWIGIRPFWWPASPGEDWTRQDAALNKKVMRVLVPMLQRQLPGCRIETDIDNQRLTELTGLMDW